MVNIKTTLIYKFDSIYLNLKLCTKIQNKEESYEKSKKVFEFEEMSSIIGSRKN